LDRNRLTAKRRRAQRRATTRLRWPILLPAGLGLLLLGAAMWWSFGRTSSTPPADFTPQSENARLVVDRESIDLGIQPVNRLVSAVFKIRNVGKATLQILGQPEVELVKGC
jgi:hypothetical protein